MNLRRYFFTLLVVFPLSSPLSAQETDEDDKFFFLLKTETRMIPSFRPEWPFSRYAKISISRTSSHLVFRAFRIALLQRSSGRMFDLNRVGCGTGHFGYRVSYHHPYRDVR